MKLFNLTSPLKLHSMKTIFCAFILGLSMQAYAQIDLGSTDDKKPVVTWEFQIECVSQSQVKLIATGAIEEGWHVYDVKKIDHVFAPSPTSIVLLDEKNYELDGPTVSTSHIIEDFDKALELNAKYFEHEVVLEQTFQVKNNTGDLNFSVEFQACSDMLCIFPMPEEHSIEIPDNCIQ